MKRLLSILLSLLLIAALSIAALAEEEPETPAANVMLGANPGDIIVTGNFEAEDGFNESISTCCAVGDELYMATYSMTKLYVQKVGAEGPEIYPLNVEMDEEGVGNTSANIVSDGTRLLMLAFTSVYDENGSSITGRLYEVNIVDGEASLTPVNDLDVSIFAGSYAMPSNWIGARDYAVGIYYTDSGDARVCTLEYATGRVRDTELDYVNGMTTYDGDSVLILRFDWNSADEAAELLRYTPATQETEQLMRVADYRGGMSGLAYDKEEGKLYCVREGEVYALNIEDNTVGEAVADLPVEVYSNATAMVLEGGYYALANYNTYIIRNLHGEVSDLRRVKVYDMTWNDAVNKAYTTFANEHRDATAIIAHDHSGEIVDEMMNHDSGVDVYVLYSGYDGLEAIRDRGYMADFTESEKLMALANRIAPNVLEDLSSEGRFAALPIELSMMNVRFNTQVLQKLGYTPDDVPSSWMGFMDFLLELQDRMPDDGSALLVDPWNSIENVRSQLMNDVFQCYQMTLRYAPEYARSEDMVAILNKLDQIDFEKFGLYHNDVTDSESFVAEYEYENILLEMDTYSQLGGSVTWRFTSTVMGLTDESPKLIATDASLAFINPYSENRDLALAFIEALAENMNKEVEYLICADMTEPVPNSYHDEALASLKEYMDDLRLQIEDAEPQDRQMLEEDLANYEKWYAEVEKDIWEISEDDIAWRNANVQYLKISGANWLYTEDAGDAWELIEQFAQGQLSPDRLMAEIDRKIRMRILENG